MLILAIEEIARQARRVHKLGRLLRRTQRVERPVEAAARLRRAMRFIWVHHGAMESHLLDLLIALLLFFLQLLLLLLLLACSWLFRLLRLLLLLGFLLADFASLGLNLELAALETAHRDHVFGDLLRIVWVLPIVEQEEPTFSLLLDHDPVFFVVVHRAARLLQVGAHGVRWRHVLAFSGVGKQVHSLCINPG